MEFSFNKNRNIIFSKIKKAQITIFIILGLIIVVVFVLIFYLINIRIPIFPVSDDIRPQNYIETCTKDSVEEAISILNVNGGDIIQKGSINYDGENITYLCYNDNYYERCINQRPLLIEHLEGEITNFITPKIEDCFVKLYYGLQKTYDEVELEKEMVVKTRLFPEQILVTIERELKIHRKDDTKKYDLYKMSKPYPLYNFAKIAMEIVNQESKYCNFDVLGYMITAPRWDISSITTGSSDTIYVIMERTTNEKFQFAVKSCLLPAGF